MQKFKSLFAVIAAVLILGTAFIVTNPVTVLAEEKQAENCFIVRIQGRATTTPILPSTEMNISTEPQYITVPQGSCVVFVNWVRGGEVMVSFEEGKTCADVTQAPTGFSMDAKLGCYVTDYLPMGKTSSLRFMQPGVYRYEIKVEGKLGPVTNGRITVSKP